MKPENLAVTNAPSGDELVLICDLLNPIEIERSLHVDVFVIERKVTECERDGEAPIAVDEVRVADQPRSLAAAVTEPPHTAGGESPGEVPAEEGDDDHSTDGQH